MSGPEVIYAVRRADGGLMAGDYTFMGVSGPDDWAPVEDWDGDSEGEFEMLRMTVEVVARRTLPECSEVDCATPAEFWGLCERHALEDDPSYFERRDGGRMTRLEALEAVAAAARESAALCGQLIWKDDPDGFEYLTSGRAGCWTTCLDRTVGTLCGGCRIADALAALDQTAPQPPGVDPQPRRGESFVADLETQAYGADRLAAVDLDDGDAQLLADSFLNMDGGA